jgi:hypothetical protein
LDEMEKNKCNARARKRILFLFGISLAVYVCARRPGQYRFISRVMVCLDSQHVLRPNKNALSKRITFIILYDGVCFVDDMCFMPRVEDCK